MRLARWTAILACAACGRIGFQARAHGDAAAIRGDAASSYEATILADHPVGYWRLGETSGLVAHDASGHGIDGSYVGGVTLGAPGAIAGDADGAITLDGTTGFVRIPNDPRLDHLTSGVATAEGWVRGGLPGAQEVWSAWDGGSTGYQLIYDNGVAGAWSGNGIVNAPIAIHDDTWHYLAAVWNATEGAIFVDGALVASGPCRFTTTMLDNQIGTQCSGSNSTTCNDFRPGEIDEVAVYDYALSAAQISAHHDAGLGTFP